jgi:hypothetical protein
MEQVLPGIYPTWASSPDGTIMVASWTFGDDPAGIAVRFRDPETGEFGPRRVVAQDVEITPLIRAFRSADRWFVLWHALHRDDPARPFSLHLAYTDDEGETWMQQDIEALRGYDFASADIATDDDGRILVAVDALDRSGNQRSAKMGVWLIRSLDRGSSWSVQNLRAGEPMRAFHARNPSVALGPGKDQALVIWEDWQTIRPRLFGSLTEDNGESWRVAHQLLPNQPDGNLLLRFSVSSVYLSDGRYQVIAERYPDSFREKHLVQFGFTPADLLAAEPSGTPTSPAPAGNSPAGGSSTEEATSQDAGADPGGALDKAEEVRVEALRERVLNFWQAMEAGDFRSAYHFYDPFFRALNSEERFTALTGKITYADYETNDITLTGALAQVNGTVRANVIPFRAPTTGELIEQDERWVPIRDPWLWIDGQWYREFYSEGKDLKYTRY